MATQSKKPAQSLYDIFRKAASKAFNYPTVRMCSDGDVITYLKKVAVLAK